MIEHRLIEKMVKLLGLELDRLNAGGRIDRAFNEAAVDFFRVYADQTHHGKEESILFRELKKKSLSAGHLSAMDKLIGEHAEARRQVGALLAAESAEEAVPSLTNLIRLYPPHIAAEDKAFFIPVMEYFSDSEKDQMLEEGRAFDRAMIHKKYEAGGFYELAKRRSA